ncbi:MAG: PKD domain-containing protein [Bacteroidales bacterium]|jgi:gliding motility-associated-like protein|nr:PKD domain-containing protein [Bacteroidales bacterium]
MRFRIALIFLFFACFGYAQAPYIHFSENNNQWPSQVKFRAALYGGFVYAESSCLTYQFFEEGAMSHSHAGISGSDDEDDELARSLQAYIEDSTAQYTHNHDSHDELGEVGVHSYKVYFKKMNTNCVLVGENQEAGVEHYYLGNNPQKWGTNVRVFQSIKYEKIYDNIDLILYDKSGGLKYDFIVHPRGKVKDIQLQYAGITQMSITADGHLSIPTSVNEVIEHKPYAYQIIDGDTVEVDCQYELEHFSVSYSVGSYDKKHSLYIDPELIFSTYSGATSDNWGFTATYDHENNAYAGGIVAGYGYPVNTGAYQENYGGGSWDVALIKYNPSGTERLYATFLGGASAEMPHSLIVDQNNNLLILGTTGSEDFPIQNAYFPTFNGGKPIVYNNVQNFNNGVDIFIAKLKADGSQLLASTYIGGSGNDGLNYDGEPLYYGRDSLYYNYADGVRGEIMLDAEDNVYVATTTFSDDFPVLNASQTVSGGSQDAVIFKFSPDLSQLYWSTYFGGESKDAAYSVDINMENEAVYVTGGTCSQSVSMPGGGFLSSRIGGTVDAFVLRLNKDMGAVENATYYGSNSYDQAHFVRVNQFGDVFIFGQTTASGNTLIYNAPYNTPNSGQFLASFSHDLSSLNWSTVFGTGVNKPNISPTAFEVDICNRIYLAGSGRDWPQTRGWIFNGSYYYYDIGWDFIMGTNDMDITPDAFQPTTDGKDFYIMVIDDQAQNLDYATYLGEQFYGSIISYDGFNIIRNGCSSSGRDHVDGGTSRFDKHGYIYQSVCASCGGCNGFPVKPDPGAWSVSNNSMNCNNAVVRFFIDFGLLIADFELPELTCGSAGLVFENKTEAHYNNPLLNYTWDFGDGSPVSHEENPSHTYIEEGEFEITLIVEDSSACNQIDSITKNITIVRDVNEIVLDEKNICEGDTVQIGISQEYDPDLTYQWTPSTGLENDTLPQTDADPSETTEYTLTISSPGWCQTIYYQTVTVHADDYAIVDIEVEINSQIKNPACEGDEVILRAITNNETYRYVWSTSPNFYPVLNSDFSRNWIEVTAQNPQRYYVKALSTYCSFEDTSSVFLDVSYNHIRALGDTLICKDDFASLDAENLIPGNTLSYTWQPSAFVSLGQGTEHVVVNPERITDFIVYAEDENNCIATDTVSVEVDELRIETYFFDQISCYGETDARIFVAPVGIPEYEYMWENGYTGPSRSDLSEGIYTVHITDSLGCTNTRDFEIIEPELLRIIDTTIYFVTCSTARNGSIQVEVAGGTKPYSYSWNNGDTTASIQNLGEGGEYTVLVTDSHGCEVQLQDAVTIGVFETLPYLDAYADKPQVFKSQSTLIYAAPDVSDTISYYWDPSIWLQSDSVPIVSATPLDDITYYVTAVDQYGCMSVDTVSISVHDWVCDENFIFVPTAFSPNNDGVNDVLKVKSGVITELQFEIFDRWGECVFSTQDLNATWEGTYKGKSLHPQVLVYYIKARCLNEEEFVQEGNITILK